MKSWEEAVRGGLVSGSAASLLSTAALALTGKLENGNGFAPTNAISHWIWSGLAEQKNGFHAKYTVPGYLIHHACAVFWAVLLEKEYGHILDKSKKGGAMRAAAFVSAAACFADYKLTPRRLRPGFEMRLSKPSLFITYASFAFGLAMGARAIRRNESGR